MDFETFINKYSFVDAKFVKDFYSLSTIPFSSNLSV